MSGPLLAIDGPSLLYRAFYALPKSIKGPQGWPVNALLGTANLVLRAIEDHDPRAVVFCFGLEAAIEGALRETPRLRGSLRDPALATYKDMATLRDVDLELPPDTPTDYEGGATAARERGMNRLAERLEKM